MDDDQRDKVNGIGKFIIKRNDDDKILFSQEIHFTSFELTEYPIYSGLITEQHLWFKYKSECVSDIMSIFGDHSEELIQYNCVSEGDKIYNCDLGNQKERKVYITLGLDYDYDINIDFYIDPTKPYVDDFYRYDDNYYFVNFKPNLLLSDGVKVEKLVLKNMDNEEKEIEKNTFSMKNDYMKIKSNNNFIEEIKIYLYVDIVIKPYYISKLILSNGTNIIYEDREIPLSNSYQPFIKFNNESYKKIIFFLNSYYISQEQFIIENEKYSDNKYIDFQNWKYNLNFQCTKEEPNILNCKNERNNDYYDYPMLYSH